MKAREFLYRNMIGTGSHFERKVAAAAALLILTVSPCFLQEKTSEAIFPRTVEGNGIYNNSIRFLVDGRVLPEGTAWDAEGCVHWKDLDTHFKLDFGEIFMIRNIAVQVDNDDGYIIEGSLDDEEFEPLVVIDPVFKGAAPGLASMSSLPEDPHYVYEMNIYPMEARYIKIRGMPGNTTFSLSEIRVYGYLTEPLSQRHTATESRIIHPDAVQGYGTFNNDAGLIIDGRIPPEGLTNDNPLAVSWKNTDAYFIIDLGKVWEVREIKLQVDHDDTYHIEYSGNGERFYYLLDIPPGLGETAEGMDTISTQVNTPEFVEGIRFHPREARYIKIYASGGDGVFALSELFVYGIALKDEEQVFQSP